MKKNLLYMFSVAINRGFIIIYSIFFISIVSLEKLGEFYLYYMFSQIIAVFIIFNGTNSLIRFGSTNKRKAAVIFNKIFFFSFILTVFIITIIYSLSLYILVFILLQAYFESLVKLTQAYFRSIDNVINFFLISIIKILPLSCFYFVSIFNNNFSSELYLNLSIFYLLGTLLMILFVKKILRFKNIFIKRDETKELFFFSLLLIPHIVSQWIMNSSDKIVIKFFESELALGEYTYYYNIAMIFLFINTFLSVVYPSYFIRNYEKIHSENKHILFLYMYTLIYSFTLLISTLYLMFDYKIIKLLPYLHSNTFKIFYYVSISYYFLGLYYILANYFIYEKKPTLISNISTFIMIFNIIITYLFVKFYGVTGGAYATLLTYISYFSLIYYMSYSYEYTPKNYLMKIFQIQLLFIIFCILLYSFIKGEFGVI